MLHSSTNLKGWERGNKESKYHPGHLSLPFYFLCFFSPQLSFLLSLIVMVARVNVCLLLQFLVCISQSFFPVFRSFHLVLAKISIKNNTVSYVVQANVFRRRNQKHGRKKNNKNTHPQDPFPRTTPHPVSTSPVM